MKKILYFAAGLLLTGLFVGCDVNDEFDGLDDSVKPTNLTSYTYELTSSDYTKIGTKIQEPITTVINVKKAEIKVYQDSLKNYAPTNTDSVRINASIAALNAEITTLQLDATYLLGATIKSKQYLTSSATGVDYIPLILNSKYLYADYNSTAQVTYNYNLENLGYLSLFNGATKYAVSDANYTSVGGKVKLLGAFTPSYPADNFIPEFLKSGIATPSAGDIAFVSYKASSIEPEISDIPVVYSKFADDFTSMTLDNFIAYSVSGDQVWGAASKYAKISGYASGANNENEDWLIIPSLDLSTAVTASISFTTAHKYAGNDLVLKYSTDYSGSGDPTTATWNELSFYYQPGLPSTWAFTPSGNVNIPGMPNANVSIAFIYTSSTTASSTWEVDDIVVSYKDLNSDIPVETYNSCYQYSGANWVKTSKVTAVSPFEYSEMGISGGCFTSTTLPETYLPTYLKQKLPLAVEGDTCVIVYNYGDATTINADKYNFVNGAWSEYSGIVTKSEPFAFSTVGWVFNPKVSLTMVASDYQLMVDYVKNSSDAFIAQFYDQKYANAEYYYGFSSYYKNVSFRLSYRNPYFTGDYVKPATIDPELSALTTNAEKSALLWERLKGGMVIFLQLRFPEAVPQINGVDVEYHITLNMYYPDCETNVTTPYTFKYKCTAAGTLPSFEYISHGVAE